MIPQLPPIKSSILLPFQKPYQLSWSTLSRFAFSFSLSLSHIFLFLPPLSIYTPRPSLSPIETQRRSHMNIPALHLLLPSFFYPMNCSSEHRQEGTLSSPPSFHVKLRRQRSIIWTLSVVSSNTLLPHEYLNVIFFSWAL